MKLAVIEIAGKQYLVKKGEIIETEKLDARMGEKLSLPRVLLTWDGKKLELGQPYLKGFTAEVEVLSKAKGPKVIAFKYKRRKDSSRKVGHRQIVFKVKFDSVSAPAGKKPAEAKGKSGSPAPAAKKSAAPAKSVKKPASPDKAKKAPARTAKKAPVRTAKKAPPKKKTAPKSKTADKKSSKR